MALRYNREWRDTHPLRIEMHCIAHYGEWDTGYPLAHHFEEMRRMLWPRLDDHRWHRLCRDEIIKNKVTVLLGPGSCGKTHEAAWIYLCEYLCKPNDTCVLVSSTDIRGLRMRVWGEIVGLWQEAKDKFDWIPGHLIDSRIAICTDDIDDDGDGDLERRARDMRKAIIGIPCVQNGQFVGLGKYAGIKQTHMRLVADEAQFMGSTFLSAFANLNKNVDFRAIVLGNPNDVNDPLGKAAEPVEGWTSYMNVEKTTVWRTRFMGGTCVNLIGTDSPNFDAPGKARYPYLISKEKIEETASFFSRESFEFRSQCIGNMGIAALERRVLSRDLCRQFRPERDVVWDGGGDRTTIAALDASYGGDRCTLRWGEFGKEAVTNKIVLKAYPPVIVPIVHRASGADPLDVEDQIAMFVKDYCSQHGIPPENFFHDSTGRGSLGTSLARIWSALCNPVEFGGQPTKRPVSLDHYIYDPLTRQRRLQRWDEHGYNFVTELWFAVRYAVEADQIRNLDDETVDELCTRKWDKTAGNKIQVEPKTGTPTKPGMKQRTGRSPDLADDFCILLEGARRRGFQISKLANNEAEAKTMDWLKDLDNKARKLERAYDLVPA